LIWFPPMLTCTREGPWSFCTCARVFIAARYRPFAEDIEVPTEPIRLRRDVPRLINIIRLVAWLHQETRGRDDEGHILATEEDFEKAIAVAGASFAQAWKSMTPTEEIVYDAITSHVP
jgi:hypothetical protein